MEKEESEPVVDNHLLTSIYDITRRIFYYLPVHSVDSCALVCRSWAQIAQLLKESRRTIHTLTYPLDPSPRELNLLDDFDSSMSSYVNDHVWSCPSLALVVVTGEFDTLGFSSAPDSPPRKSSKRSTTQAVATGKKQFHLAPALLRHLNRSCRMLMVVADGIITSNDEHQSNEIEYGNAFGLLLLPKFSPNICGIYPFEIPSRTRLTNLSRTDLHQILGDVPEDFSIRAVFLFFRTRQKQLNDCLKTLITHYPSKVAIMGGLIDEIRNRDGESSSANICGFVLTGDQTHFDVRQVVLDSDIDSRAAIGEKLKLLKSPHYEQSKMSFAVQVTCVGRGAEFYNDEKNVESSEFRRLFPRTSLIGVFGNGELGHDYLPNDDGQSSSPSTSTELLHSYSTVFSLISIRL